MIARENFAGRTGVTLRRWRLMTTLPAALLAGCGGSDDAAAPSTPIVTPSPSPSPTPSPTPTATPGPAAASVQRLRAALAFGRAPVAVPVAVTVTTLANKSAYATSVSVAPDDPRLRLLGGRFVRGVGFPSNLVLFPQAATAFAPDTIGGTGLPTSRYGLNNGVAFVLPANQSDFELTFLGAGTNYRVRLLIDGVATDQQGYESGIASTGAFYHVRFQLPASTVARTIQVDPGNRPFAGLLLPDGQTLGTLPAIRASVVFQGDSITEGSVATHPDMTYVMQAAFRLGVDNPINIGLGATGYLTRGAAQRYTFRERLDDVVRAVGDGPPDAVVIAGGINDCGVTPGGIGAAQVGDEALLYFQALRAAAPQTVIFVLGPFTDYNNPTYSATSRACRDAIFAAAGKVADTYTIDVADWVTTENRGVIFNGSVNGPHPLDAGHAIYGERLAQAISAILNRLP